MLSETLHTSHRQYKHDTDVVASWLVATAAKCGIEVTRSPPTYNKKSKGRQYTISLGAFETLSAAIAEYQPSIPVPGKIIRALDRAITLRRGHGDLVNAQSLLNLRTSQDSEKHDYFVNVLERVRATLRPLRKAGALDIASAAEAGDEYEVNASNDATEAIFALHSLISDLVSLRKRVSSIWANYRERICDLSAVAVATNTAIDLARSLETDVEEVIRAGFSVRTSSDILLPYYEASCRKSGQDASYREQPSDDLNFRTYDLADALFVPACLLLNSFCDIIQSGALPSYKQNYFGAYDANSDRDRMGDREKYAEDKIIMLEALPDFFLVCESGSHVLAEDELIRGLRTFFKTKDQPIWLTFAATIYIDIHHVLRGQINRGFLELVCGAKCIDSTVRENLDFHKSLKIMTWPSSNDYIFYQILDRINQWVYNDPVTRAKRSLGLSAVVEHSFMKQHPLFAGLFLYQLRILYHNVGVDFANAWGSILSAAHLYRSLSAHQLVKCRWNDMEMIICGQDLGLVPIETNCKEPGGLLRHYLHIFGYDAGVLGPGTPANQPLPSTETPRILANKAPLAQVFKSRFCENSGKIDYTKQDIEVLLQESSFYVKRGKTLAVYRKHEGVKNRKRSAERSMKADDLIKILLVHIDTELYELSFDYFQMHRSCWQLLKDINNHCKETLASHFGVNYLRDQSQLPFVVGYIFAAATASEDLASLARLRKKRVPMSVTSLPLTEASQQIEAWLESSETSIGPVKRKNMCISALKEYFGMSVRVEE